MTKSTGPKASWSDKEVEVLIAFLHDHRAEAGDGGSFKTTTFNAVADHLLPFFNQGLKRQIRKIYMEIETYRLSVSGCHWDNTNGANIQGKDADVVWDEYVKNHVLLCPFKNKGWPLYQCMQDIMPSGGARGNNVFSPEMGIPEVIKTMVETTDDVGPQPQPEAMNSGLGSASGSISVKGKKYVIIPIILSNLQTVSTLSFCTGAPTSSTGKRSHSDMTGNDSMSINTSSALPFSSSVPSHSTSRKKINLTAAMATAAVAPPSCKAASAWQSHTAAESLMLGMQGSLNLLTSSLNNSNITTEDKVSARRETALKMLHEQDGDLPKDVKAFIRAMVAQDVGFTKVYILTPDKDEHTDFVRAQVEGMRGKLLANEPLLQAVTIPKPF